MLKVFNYFAPHSGKLALVITTILFCIPFFWLKPGFVDLGGDAGRLYFLDPWATAKNTYSSASVLAYASYAIVPYELYLTVLKTCITSPTYLIAFERGLQLSLSFFSMYLIVCELLTLTGHGTDKRKGWAGIAAGVVYIGCITKSGWVLSLETQSQVFLNPLIFYLILRLLITSRFRYAIGALIFTLLYSGSFGFSASPQLMTFYPLSIFFLLFTAHHVCKRKIPWKSLLLAAFFFVGLHAFHIIPMAASFLNQSSFYRNYVFTEQSIQYSGVHYFDVNHEALGKISTELFQPILIVPVIILLGFIKRPSKLQGIIGIFFAVTFFLVSANITKLGVLIYRTLFYIPGFMMFRSFNERWYMIFVFFYTLLFAFSFYSLVRNKRYWTGITLAIITLGLTGFRVFPFLQGKAIDVPHYQSKNVSPVFKIDSNLLDSLSFVRALPQNSAFLTLPLTFPYYQIAYGSEGGAYVGVSMISRLAGKLDYAGFWSFGEYAQPMFDAIRTSDVPEILRILSTLNIRYVFYNSDSRVIDNFPGYPYIYPGLMYSSKDQLPAIRDQSAYKIFLASLPLKRIYENGYYSVYEIQYPQGKAPREPQRKDTTLQPYINAGRIISESTLAIITLICTYEIVRKHYEKK